MAALRPSALHASTCSAIFNDKSSNSNQGLDPSSQRKADRVKSLCLPQPRSRETTSAGIAG